MNNKQSQNFCNKVFSVPIIGIVIFISNISIFGCSPKISTSNQSTNAGVIQSTNVGVIKSTNADTIVDVASTNNSLNTFVNVLKASDSVKILSGKEKFTVFAPTNAAFASLPKGTLEKLLKPENKTKLQKILAYHIIPGVFDNKTLQSGQCITLEGSPVNINVNRSCSTVNNARVITPNIKASNGVIHTINTVILPPGLKL